MPSMIRHLSRLLDSLDLLMLLPAQAQTDDIERASNRTDRPKSEYFVMLLRHCRDHETGYWAPKASLAHVGWLAGW